ncbi:MAG: hypothetical protein JWN48_4039 [Myxococcaceae bacterium]|nr:hypothetical protein [Myxococcaceae bacterium]
MVTVGDAVLILAQEGAEVEPVLSAWQRSVDEPSVMVLQQEAGESLTDFKRRLHLRLAGIERGGHGIERGAFVAKSGFGLPDVLATVALLSSLVATMVAVGIGQVFLCGHAGDARARVALEALADAMRDQVRGTGVEVVTEDSRSESGLHMVVSGAASRRSSASGA